MNAHAHPERGEHAFRHEALLYAGRDQFVDGVVTFIREASTGEQPVLVVVNADRIAALREALDGDADRVLFADMAAVGANPARIIPAWREFVDRHGAPAGGSLWGVGEPIYAERTPAELVECHRHEALLNMALADAHLTLLCPYDVDSLSDAVIAEARRNHPFIRSAGATVTSREFPGTQALAAPSTEPLPEAPAGTPARAFGPDGLAALRSFVLEQATTAGMVRERADNLVLAINELATNSILHGGGHGRAAIWRDGDSLICDVYDNGAVTDPLVGRRHPPTSAAGGRGLWVAHQLCDLVALRSLPTGGVARVHMRLA